MELVVDANILFSALIKDSLTAELLFEPALKLYTPEFLLEEFTKYEELILKKINRSKEKYIEIFHCLKDIINFIPEEEFSEFLHEAEIISPDIKDTAYIALALKMKCPVWSNDKTLKNQKIITVYSTSDLIKIIDENY